MKRLREDDGQDEIDGSLTLNCICSGILLHPDQDEDRFFLVMTVMKGKHLTNSLYCLLLDETSSVLLSPVIIHNITIEPLFLDNKWDVNNEKLSIKNYPCYKLTSILPSSSSFNRFYNIKHNIAKTDDIKILIQNTFYNYSILFKSPLPLSHNSQSKIIENVFLKNHYPIINYHYDGHFFLVDLITTLFHVTHKKNKNPPPSKKQKRSNEDEIEEIDDENEDIAVMSELSPLDMWNTISKRYSDVEKFLETKFYDYHTKKQTKQYENEELLIKELRKWDGYSIFYYRLDSYKYIVNIIDLVGSYFNNYGGLSYFNDKQIIKIHNLLLSSIRYYNDNNPTIRLNELTPIIQRFNITIEKYFIVKKVNILEIIINIITTIYGQVNKDCIIGIFLDYFIDYLISWCKTEILSKCMTLYIVKYNTILYLLNKFFSKSFNINTDVLEAHLISNISIYKFICILFSKLPPLFKVNNEYNLLFTESKITPYTELLCYYNVDDQNFKVEEINFNINKHKNIFHKSYVTTCLDKFSPLILNGGKTYLIDYLCIKKQEIASNNDLKSLEPIINSNFNNFTIIHQNINYSKKRTTNFINNLIKMKGAKLEEKIENEKEFLLQEFGEEIFDPDEEEPINTTTTTTNHQEIQSIKDITLINKDRMKLLIVLDCHVLDINEWYDLMNWIISNLKNSIKNVIFIGCPFITRTKSIGQPFIDSLFQINEKAIKSLLYNKVNINSNKELLPEGDQVFFKKDSFTILSQINVFK